LGISWYSLAYQLSPRHNFHAYLSGFDIEPKAVTVDLLLINEGNQVEALDGAFVGDPMGCIVGGSGPRVVKAAEAAIVPLTINIPYESFRDSDARKGLEDFAVSLVIVGQSKSNPDDQLLHRNIKKAIEIGVDAKGRMTMTTPKMYRRPIDLYDNPGPSFHPAKGCTRSIVAMPSK
jgi:hypothetical protein